MKPPKVIFLTFANDREFPDRFLIHLEPEKEAIEYNLIPIQKKFPIIVKTAPTSKSFELIKHLNQFQNQLIIFHFSGHANGTSLSIKAKDEKNISYDKSNLASLLDNEENLKLVFLNGCNTHEQVPVLQEIGIPAIIATENSIPDKDAAEFASSFYDSLARGQSLINAFLKAKSIIDPSHEKHIFRDSKSLILEKKVSWGLYVQDEKMLNWRLPKEFSRKRKWLSLLFPIGITILIFLAGLLPKNRVQVSMEVFTKTLQVDLEQDWELDTLLTLNRFRSDDILMLSSRKIGDSIQRTEAFEVDIMKLSQSNFNKIMLHEGTISIKAEEHIYLDKSDYLLTMGIIDGKAITGKIDIMGSELRVSSEDSSSAIQFPENKPSSLSFVTQDAPYFYLEGDVSLNNLSVNSTSFWDSPNPSERKFESRVDSGFIFIHDTKKLIPLENNWEVSNSNAKGILSATSKFKQTNLKVSYKGELNDLEIGVRDEITKIRPTWIEYFYNNERLKLFWGVLIYLLGISFAIQKYLVKTNRL